MKSKKQHPSPSGADTTASPIPPKPEVLARLEYERSYRTRIVRAVLPAILGVLLFILPGSAITWIYPTAHFDELGFYSDRAEGILRLAAFVLFAFSSLTVIMMYLQTGFKRDYRETEILRDYEMQFEKRQ